MPGAVTESLLEPFGYGLGFRDFIFVTNPGAGNQATFQVPGDYYMRVLTTRCLFNTSAVVANRFVSVDFRNARNTVLVTNAAPVLVLANTSAQLIEWDARRTQGEWNTGTPIFSALSPWLLEPGMSIKWNVLNIDAGDSMTNIQLWVEKFNTGPRGYQTGMVRDVFDVDSYDDPEVDVPPVAAYSVG